MGLSFNSSQSCSKLDAFYNWFVLAFNKKKKKNKKKLKISFTIVTTLTTAPTVTIVTSVKSVTSIMFLQFAGILWLQLQLLVFYVFMVGASFSISCLRGCCNFEYFFCLHGCCNFEDLWFIWLLQQQTNIPFLRYFSNPITLRFDSLWSKY